MTTRRPGLPGEIPAHIDRAADTPLPVQLAAALREAIDSSLLRPGERVPATRDYARRLGVARGVVVAAYEQLIAEGYLTAGFGRGTVVNSELDAVASMSRSPLAPADTVPAAQGTERANVMRHQPAALAESQPGARTRERGLLAPGTPITDVVDRPAWRAAWRAAAKDAHRTSPALGDPRLRAAIADHLRHMRGTARSADDVLVTAGTREGLGLLLTATGTTRGHELVVGVEDPGYPSLRGVAARHGARIVALPVDGDGLRTDTLPHGVLDMVIVTPSHQYPVGGSLPLSRRHQLIEWARSAGVIIIEDDYDSELRHVGSPLPALAALDDPRDGAVVTLGTFSSTITPALAAGFLVAPSRIRAVLEPVRDELGSPVSTVVQLALGEYLLSGELKHNVQRVRRLYAARRDRLSDRLAGVVGVRVRPMSGGLHAVIELGAGSAARERERLVLVDAELAGLGVASLGRYWQRRGQGRTADETAGIVIGMGGPDHAAFEASLETLREILRVRRPLA